MFGSRHRHQQASTHSKNVLVIGGAGFIGSHLCEALVADARVICVDDLATGMAQHIEPLRTHPHFEFINHDITRPLDLLSIRELAPWNIRSQGIQEIYLLACPVSQAHFESSKVAAAMINSIGVKQALDVAVRFGAPIVYGSTGALYGARRAGYHRAAEKDGCHADHLTPRGMVDEGQRFAESLVQTYATVHGISAKIARIFRTYGARMRENDGHVLPDLIAAAARGDDLVLPGNEQTRVTFCEVSDVVRGLRKLMEIPLAHAVVNIGSDEELPLIQVAEQVRQLTGSSSRIRFEPMSDWFLEEATPDLSRAREILAWSPTVRLPHGLKNMING
ncbi:MAG: hypothetical protein RL141_933 [Candidatus Parcubacteria bacterium]|jgi:UDP-glucuronate decarboxylase